MIYCSNSLNAAPRAENIELPAKAHNRWTMEYGDKMEFYRKWFTTGVKKTRFDNAQKLKAYCEWIGKTPDALLEEYIEARKSVNTMNDWKREVRQRILEFYTYLKEERGYKINTARQATVGILTFYSAHAETIKAATKALPPVQIPENEFVFTQDDLRKMFYYADTEEKALLSTAVCLGYGSADFVALETDKIKNLILEARDKKLDFIEFIGKTRMKTSVQPRSFLTPEAIDSLREYLALLEKKYGKLPRYLWSNGTSETPFTNQGLNKKLRRILEKANIQSYGKVVHFHLLRKFLYSRLQAKNRDIAKVIVAKKVSMSDLTYIPNLDAECGRVFKETYKEIALNGDLTGKAKREQAESIDALRKELEDVKTFNRMLQQAYGDEIVKKAREALEKGTMTYDQVTTIEKILRKRD